MSLINSVSELKGRLIAYLGGTGVSATSVSAQSAIQQSQAGAGDILTWSILPGVSLGSALTIIGALIVMSRFAFDVWKYFEQRKKEKESEK